MSTTEYEKGRRQKAALKHKRSVVNSNTENEEVQRQLLHDALYAKEESGSDTNNNIGNIPSQDKPDDRESGTANQVESISDSGHPLESTDREFYESRLGRDLQQVRIHTDEKANQLARSMDARAFTSGKDVVFGKNEYRPYTNSGRRLLAHELAHVLQQNSDPSIHNIKNRITGKGNVPNIQRQPTSWALDTGKIYSDRAGAVARGRELQQTYTGIEIVKHGPKKYQVKYKNPVPIHTGGFPKDDTGYYYRTQPEAEERARSLRAYGYDVEVFQRTKDSNFQCRIKGLLGTKPGLPTKLGLDAGFIYAHAASANKRLAGLEKAGFSGSVETVGKGNFQVRITHLPTYGGVAVVKGTATPSKATAVSKGTAATTATSKSTTTSKSTKATTTTTKTAPKATSALVSLVTGGHLPGKDYGKGRVLERSFLRKSDLKTKIIHGKYNLFFENGQEVKLLGTSKFWVRVEGEVYYDTKNPKRLESKTKSSVVTATRMTGWIERAWTDMTIGKYKGLDIEDVSYKLGKLGKSTFISSSKIKNIVLHRTGSALAQSDLNTYAARIKSGSHTGAQYLIGKTGKIYLVVPLTRSVSHVGKTLPSMGHIKSETSIGIEHVGTAYKIKTKPKTYKDSAKMKVLRDELKKKVTLSPALKARLLALSDRDLHNQLKWSGWAIYEDLTGSQKRATFLLTGRLMREFGLTINELIAHEKARAKTIGEGENIKEFLVAMRDYKRNVKQLRKRANAEAKLQKLSAFMQIVTHEENMVKAVDLDKTDAENSALAKEKAAKVKGPASMREEMRVKFYNQFFARFKQLTDLVTLVKASVLDTSKINAAVAKWLK